LNTHSFKQKPEVYYKEDNIASLVTNNVVIRVILVIMLVLQLLASVIDIKGAFLQEEFSSNEKDIFIKVPDRLENKYPKDI